MKKNKMAEAFCEIVKIFLNALYGQMLMRWHNETTMTCNNEAEFWKFQFDNDITDIKIDNDGYIHLTGKPVNKDNQLKRISRPIQIGVFILAYSRRLLLHFVKAIDPSLQFLVVWYCDIDSLYVTAEHADILEKEGLFLPKEKKLGFPSNDI